MVKKNPFLFLALILWGAVLITGLCSELTIGDEVHHFRFARFIYEAGERVVFDPLYGSINPPGFPFVTEPLWHALLALIFNVVGQSSFAAAQAYHSLYFLLLLILVYRYSRQEWGESSALTATVLVGTTPALAAFSILFYIDVPSAAVSFLCFFFIQRDRIVLASLTVCLMIFLKISGLFFYPGFMLLIWLKSQHTVRKRLWHSFLFMLLPCLAAVPEFRWRAHHLYVAPEIVNYMSSVADGFGDGGFGGWIKNDIAGMLKHLEEVQPFLRRTLRPENYQPYYDASLANPKDVIRYMGLVPVLFLAFLVRKPRELIKNHGPLVPVITYMLVFPLLIFIFFHYAVKNALELRYYLGVVPFIGLMIAPILTRISNSGKRFIIALCFLQFFATLFYVQKHREIPEAKHRAYEFVRSNVPEDAFILYTEYLLTEKTGRRVTWAGRGNVKELLWAEDEAAMTEALRNTPATYLMVDPRRIYDDSEVKHFGGFPRSFVNKLSSRPYLEKIYDDAGFMIYRVRKEALRKAS